MRQFHLPDIEWFQPVLNKFKYFQNLNTKELFKYSTRELIQKYNQNPSDLARILLAERFILENMEENFFSEELLELVLEDRYICGCLMEISENFVKGLNNFSFFKLDKNIYFYPLEWRNIKKLLKSFWRRNCPFYSIEICLNKSDLKNIKEFLKLAKILDFSYLSKKTLDVLKNYLPTVDIKVLENINYEFLKGSIKVLGLIDFNSQVSKEIEESLKDMQKLIKSDNKILFISDTYEDLEFLKVFEELPIKAGIITSRLWSQYGIDKTAPLIYVIGALEHAKRLNDKNQKIIFFEGFTYHVIGDLYYEWGDLSKALKYYSLAKEYTKQPIELALSEAAIYYILGDLDKAEEILKAQLCGCVKEDPMVHHNIGLIYFKKEEIEKAKFHFYKAYLLEPNNRIFRESLIKFLWDIRAYEELEELLNSVDNLTEKEEIISGKLAFYKKDYKKAFESLKKIFTFPDRDGETLLFLAWLYLYFNKEREVSEILLKEAKGILNNKEFDKIVKSLGLDLK